jgi:hypothetical protein
MQLETAVILVLISLCMVVYWLRYGSGSSGCGSGCGSGAGWVAVAGVAVGVDAA